MSWFGPKGYTLMRIDGTRHNMIRGDMFPSDTITVVADGRVFVRTGLKDDVGFRVYQEGHKTHEYKAW